jgi:hypothetical protein
MRDGNISGLTANNMTRLAEGTEKDHGVSDHSGHKGQDFKLVTTRYDMNTAAIIIIITIDVVIIFINIVIIITTTCIIIMINTAQIVLTLKF